MRILTYIILTVFSLSVNTLLPSALNKCCFICVGEVLRKSWMQRFLFNKSKITVCQSFFNFYTSNTEGIELRILFTEPQHCIIGFKHCGVQFADKRFRV